MTEHVGEFPALIPRDAYTDREFPRSGGIWRVCQDVATLSSIASGWPPRRFRDEGVFFIVYRMVMVHSSQPRYGTPLRGTTWVSRLRRDMLSTREVRLRSDDGLVAAATQEWVHVDAETRKPKRAKPETAAAFPPVEVEASAKLPSFDKIPGSRSSFEFQMWQTAADPLGHANHPAYIDWCDEGASRRLAASGINPTLLVPVAEQVTFKDSVLPGEEVIVHTARAGTVGSDAVVLKHTIETKRGLAADATSVRRLASGSHDFIGVWD
ncbi:MAG: acyl-ACP thioesterase domain-containing protein [Myxococcota bacterium]